MDRKEIKAKAKEFAFKNKWNLWKPYLLVWLVAFVFGIVMSIFSEQPVLSRILTLAFDLAVIPVGTGIMYYTIELIKGNQLNVKDMAIA